MSDVAKQPPTGTASAPESRRNGRLQTPLALLIVAVMLLSNASVAALSRCQPLLGWMLDRQMRTWRRTNVIYAYNLGYIDADDRLLLWDIPETDYRQGGVFFIGSSTTQHSIATWLLPAEEQNLVHNFAIKSANTTEQFQFVRYLVEQRGLLGGAPGKTMVVLGLAHFDTRPKITGTVDWNYVPALFARHDLYSYDPVTGISDRSLARPLRFLQFERMRSYNFLESLVRHASFSGPAFGAEAKPNPESDKAARAFVERMMGYDDWKHNMNAQLQQLELMIDYLHQHGAIVSAVLLPLASWNHDLPVATEFDARVRDICRRRDVSLTDLTWSMPDSDFADHSHLNYLGQEATTRILGGMARDHLLASGLLRQR
jgi:hypothetical protein